MHRILRIFKFTFDSNIPMLIIPIDSCQRNTASSGRVKIQEYEEDGTVDALTAVGSHL